jgi:hypothetical protein
MPHQALKLLPGVDQNKTPALNEAAISVSQLVRFIPDRTLGGIVQKLGGWTKFFPSKIGSIVRALWAWEDTNANSYLAVGADGIAPIEVTGASGNGSGTATLTYTGPFTFVVGNSITVSGITPAGYNGVYVVTGSTPTSVSYASTETGSYVSGGLIAGGGASLEVIIAGNSTDITPQTTTINATVDFSTTSGSNEVVIHINDSGIDVYDVVDIQTQVSVGGLVLFGQYTVSNPTFDPDNFSIFATDVLGDPALATSTVSNGGAVPVFDTTSGSNFVSVTLNNHGLVVGDTFPILIATSVGGITLYGNYTVTDVTSSNVFVISGSTSASSTATASENAGDLHVIAYNGIGPVPAGTGYGIGPYGGGGYGTGIPPAVGTGTPINAVDWTLDNWGEILIANPLGGPIYSWNPATGDPVAQIIANAPPVNQGAFVAMPQRQIIAWGSTFTGVIDPLLIRWCDVNDYDVWIASLTNQAGSYRIPKGSRIVECIQGPQQGLVWTDLGLWAMQYAGPPYVYQFNELGNGCGLVGRKAAGSINGAVYWMGQSQFYRLSGNGVEPVRCPVWDVVFQDLDTTNLDKIRFAANSRFGEVTWYFPTNSNGGENEGYVKYNIVLDQWDYGFNSTANPYVARSAWINESVLGPPIGAGLNEYIYQHETSTDADGVAMNSYFQTGYFVLTEADVKMFIDQVWPDMKWGYFGGVQNANVLLTFYITDYPGTTPTAFGPYTLTQATQYITPRFRGRLVSIKIESNDTGSFWRLGNIRYRLQPDGRF